MSICHSLKSSAVTRVMPGGRWSWILGTRVGQLEGGCFVGGLRVNLCQFLEVVISISHRGCGALGS